MGSFSHLHSWLQNPHLPEDFPGGLAPTLWKAEGISTSSSWATSRPVYYSEFTMDSAL